VIASYLDISFVIIKLLCFVKINLQFK